MILELLEKELKAIAAGGRHLPINLLLLFLATIKAIVSETQSQLIAIFSALIGLRWGLEIAITVFVGIYTFLYFIVDKLNFVLKSRPPPNVNQ